MFNPYSHSHHSNKDGSHEPLITLPKFLKMIDPMMHNPNLYKPMTMVSHHCLLIRNEKLDKLPTTPSDDNEVTIQIVLVLSGCSSVQAALSTVVLLLNGNETVF